MLGARRRVPGARGAGELRGRAGLTARAGGGLPRGALKSKVLFSCGSGASAGVWPAAVPAWAARSRELCCDTLLL